MKRRQCWVLAAFCLLAGSRWLVEGVSPSSLTPLWRQGLHYGLIGMAALAFWALRGQRRLVAWPRIALASILLLGLPALLNEASREVVSQSGAALSTLVPLFVVLAVAAWNAGSHGRALMLPALCGVAGGLLLLPFQFPSTIYGFLLLGLMLVALVMTAAGSVWLHVLIGPSEIAPVVVVMCVANAVLLGAAAMVVEGVPASAAGLVGEVLRCMVFDLPALVLLAWLLREMAPARLASRYLFAPLVTVLEGVFVLRAQPDPRMGVALLLMLAGGTALLLWDETDAPLKLGIG